MVDQFIVGNKASYDDFDASLKQRVIHTPKKKTIKETVPYFNGAYDFSKINGELYWEERTLEYVFEIDATSPEELEQKKVLFSAWIMNVMGEELHDPYDLDFHFIGTYDDMDYEDDEDVEKTTATVTFSAYPYKIANVPTQYFFKIPAASEIQKIVVNSSSHRITPILVSDGDMSIQMGNATYSLTAGTFEDDDFKLEPGTTILTISNSGSVECGLTIEFYAEVF